MLKKCNHKEHPANWSNGKWVCCNCRKEYDCPIKAEYKKDVNPCCPNYPHNMVEPEIKIQADLTPNSDMVIKEMSNKRWKTDYFESEKCKKPTICKRCNSPLIGCLCPRVKEIIPENNLEIRFSKDENLETFFEIKSGEKLYEALKENWEAQIELEQKIKELLKSQQEVIKEEIIEKIKGDIDTLINEQKDNMKICTGLGMTRCILRRYY